MACVRDRHPAADGKDAPPFAYPLMLAAFVPRAKRLLPTR